MPAVTVEQLENASRDADDLGLVVNGSAGAADVVTRTGPTIKPLAKVIAEVQAEADALAASVDDAIAAVAATPGSGQYATVADALSMGVASVAITAAGSGGTNGTYPWTTTGGGGSGAAGYLVVAGGAVTQVVVEHRGVGYTSAPTLAYTVAGLTGETFSVSRTQNETEGAFFNVVADGSYATYEVDAGNATATLQARYVTLQDGSIVLTEVEGGGGGNVFVGVDISPSAITTGYDNTGAGYRTGKALTSGIGNTLAGAFAAILLTIGSANTATGQYALTSAVSADDNTAVGAYALTDTTGNGNTGVGRSAGADITSGEYNVGVGADSLHGLTTGDYNLAAGTNAGYNLSGASELNVAIGTSALGAPVGGARVVNSTTAVGTSAGIESLGDRGVYLGFGAGAYVEQDDLLVIDNRDRGTEADVLIKSLVVGKMATDRDDQYLRVNGVLWSLDGKLEMLDGQGNGSQGNVSIGVGLTSVLTGNSITRIGYKAGANMTSATGCTAIGENALTSCTTGINNTAIGWDSQFVNVSGTNNTSVGEDSLKYVTGDGNTALGYTAGYSISSGLENVAIAPRALYNVTTGDYNVGIGWGAGDGLATDSSRNVIIGHHAFKTGGGSAVVATDNVIIGTAAGRESDASRSIFIGYGAGYSELNDDRFQVSNVAAAGPTTALLYGVMHGTPTPASQSLTVNGHLYGNTATSIGWTDARLYRDAAAQIGVRDGATAQSLAVYNTYTSSTVYERYRARWSSNVIVVGPEAGGSGGTVRRVEHTTSITDGWAVKTTADNTYTKLGGFEAPNLTAGRNAYIEVGVAGGASGGGYSAGVINFGYVGASSTSNYLGFGFYTGLDILNVVATQRVGIKEKSPDYVLDVNGSFGFTPGSSVTPVDNGDIVIEFTNNTTVTMRAKGSDGTVRTIAWTVT